MSPVVAARPARVFYGWWVALALVIIAFLSRGVRFTVGPFLKPIVSDLGLDRGSFSLVISVSLFLYGAFMPLVGLSLTVCQGRPGRWGAGAAVMSRPEPRPVAGGR
jgi:cyanate permease